MPIKWPNILCFYAQTWYNYALFIYKNVTAHISCVLGLLAHFAFDKYPSVGIFNSYIQCTILSQQECSCSIGFDASYNIHYFPALCRMNTLKRLAQVWGKLCLHISDHNVLVEISVLCHYNTEIYKMPIMSKIILG